MEDLERIWRRRQVRLLVGGIAIAAVTLVTLLIAIPRTFVGFAFYDDEGYMLIALRSFLQHGHLYDDVFSQYGPFYYEFWGGFFEIFGISANHDGGRTATIVAWVGASLILGLAVWRMTRSNLLGLATQILVFGAIISVVNEPMHPGGLTCLLLAVSVGVSCFVRRGPSPLAMAFLGGASMALILVKINVGVFALLALALACMASYPALSRWRFSRPATEVLFVAVPLLVMGSKLGDDWVRHYAVHVAVAALAVVIALRARAVQQRDGEELWWLGGGLLVVGATICATILAAGTTPAGLVEGVISQPLRQSDLYATEFVLSSRTYLFDLLGLLGAVTFWYFARYREGPPSSALVSAAAVVTVLVGVEMALSVIGRTILFGVNDFPGYQIGLLSFAWVALIPPLRDEGDAAAFARLLLPPLAVLQGLHAFPVAGSQVQWSAFLLVPVGALCVAGGAGMLSIAIGDGRERRVIRAIGVVVAAGMLLILANNQLRKPLNEARAAYDGSVSLGLPGAEEVHLSPEDAELYRSVTEAIDRSCRSLITMPGMNSFYLWSEIDPPTGYNATAWMMMFDDAHQQRIVDETRSDRDLCLLENESMAELWNQGGVPDGPLIDYLHEDFSPVATIDNYRLLRREGPGPS
jgi:hypothetical protein